MNLDREQPVGDMNLAAENKSVHYISEEDMEYRRDSVAFIQGFLFGARVGLTDRQIEVATLRMQGKSFGDIGQVLNIHKSVAFRHFQAVINKARKSAEHGNLTAISEGTNGIL